MLYLQRKGVLCPARVCENAEKSGIKMYEKDTKPKYFAPVAEFIRFSGLNDCMTASLGEEQEKENDKDYVDMPFGGK